MNSKQEWLQARSELDAIEKERDALLEPTNDGYEAAREKLALVEDECGELIGRCEGCESPVFDGDKYFPCVDIVILCEACAPTYDMLLIERDFFVDSDEEPLSPERCREIFDAHIAAGGKPDDSMARV